MRLPLSHVIVFCVLGLALAAVPGVSLPRVGARDGSVRAATRGGFHRSDASDAVLHSGDSAAPEAVVSGDVAADPTTQRDHHDVPALAAARAVVPALPAAAPGVDRAAALPPAARFLRPPGRAPPLG